MRVVWSFFLAGLLAAGVVQAEGEGLISKQSAHPVGATLDRLEDALEEKGITVALRWSHSERADAAGIALR